VERLAGLEEDGTVGNPKVWSLLEYRNYLKWVKELMFALFARLGTV
jgi:hypothetical protein